MCFSLFYSPIDINIYIIGVFFMFGIAREYPDGVFILQ